MEIWTAVRIEILPMIWTIVKKSTRTIYTGYDTLNDIFSIIPLKQWYNYLSIDCKKAVVFGGKKWSAAFSCLTLISCAQQYF